MNSHPSAVWPEHQHYLRPVIATLFMLAIAVLAVCVSKRVPGRKGWRQLSLVKASVLYLLIDSFVFLLTSAVVIFGVGTSLNLAACSLGIWWCIMLYATTKFAIYVFLMERVHIIRTNRIIRGAPSSRFSSKWYRVATFLLACWIGVAITMMAGRISYIREHDGACVIGLKLFATAGMLSVDFIVNVFLTSAFVVPVYRSRFNKAQNLAKKSCFAACVALITSIVNIAILTAQHGRQLSWVCLSSCGLDVFVNAMAIFLITCDTADKDPISVGSLSAGGGAKSAHLFRLDSCPRPPCPARIAVHSEMMIHKDRERGHAFVTSQSAWDSESREALTEVRVELPSGAERDRGKSPEGQEQRDGDPMGAYQV